MNLNQKGPVESGEACLQGHTGAPRALSLGTSSCLWAPRRVDVDFGVGWGVTVHGPGDREGLTCQPLSAVR